MKKVVLFFPLVLFCSIAVFGQNMSLPSSWFYEQQLQANGCGAADGWDVPDFIFTAACNAHDLDYGRLGRPRNISDARFMANIAQSCRAVFGNLSSTAVSGCVAIGSIYFIGVRVGGSGAYNKAQALARKLQEAKERERGMCYASDVYVQENNGTYYIAIDW
jgi:hypothetical protein